MAVDWLRGDLTHRLRLVQVDPITLAVRGELSGPMPTGTLSLDYYADTKASAKVETSNEGGDGWDGTAAIRLVHEVSDYTGLLLTENLFTGYVRERSVETSAGTNHVSYELGSALWAMQDDLSVGNSIARGSNVRTAMDAVFRACMGRRHRYASDATGAAASSAIVWKPSTSHLSMLYEMCDVCGTRLDLDGDGTVVVRKYVAPSDRGADYDCNAVPGRGDLIGPITTADAEVLLDSGHMVTATSGDATVVGTAHRGSGRASAAQRGYNKIGHTSETELSPFTNARAASAAVGYLNRESAIWEVSHGMTYKPLSIGAIERLHLDGQARKWLVKSADLDMARWTWKLDIKGGW